MSKIQNKNWLSTAGELFYILVILLVCVKLSYALADVMDIRLYDESAYLHQGSQFQAGYLFRDGFIYLAWYKLLSLLVTDAMTLYYFNYIVLLCINPFLIYILLRKMGKERFIAAFFSVLFLVSTVNVTAWPFITRLALALILGTFILILSVKNKRTKYLIALLGLCLLVYTRPEYILTLVIFTLGAVIYLLHRWSKTRGRPGRVLLVFLCLTVILTIFILLVKNPANPGRSVMAFGQHYGVHLYKQGKISIDPNSNWKKIMTENFGTHQSITKALFNNPAEMARHVAANIKDLPYQTMQLFFPYNIENKTIKKILLVIAGLLFLFLIIRAIKKRKRGEFFQGERLNDDIFYSLAILIMIPLIMSVCFIFPREHYLLILFALLLIMAIKNLPPIPENARTRWVPYLIMLLILFWVPWRASGKSGLWPRDIRDIHQDCSNVKIIKFIRSIKTKGTVVFLGHDSSLEPYIDNFKQVEAHSKNVPFNQYLQQEKINMILVNHILLNDPRFSSDNEFKAFISHLPGDQWEKIKIPGCMGFLAVKAAKENSHKKTQKNV